MGAKRKRVSEKAGPQVGEPAEPCKEAEQEAAQDEGEPDDFSVLAQKLEEGILEILQGRRPGSTC